MQRTMIIRGPGVREIHFAPALGQRLSLPATHMTPIHRRGDWIERDKAFVVQMTMAVGDAQA